MKNENDWIKTYWNAMLREDFETAIFLKNKHFPKSFFKYKNLNKWTIKSLESNEIHLAEMNSLNDPFECVLQFDNDECLRHYHRDQKFQQGFAEKFGTPLTRNEIESLTTDPKPYETYLDICKRRNITNTITPEQQLQRMQNRFSRILIEQSQRLRVTCFTQRNDSLLMWSHYANEHKGICLEYDLENQDHIRPFLQPVHYSDRVHKIGLFEELNTISLVCSSLVKSQEWSYEAEWRITSFKQGEIFPKQVYVPDPIAVYIGSRFEQNNSKEKAKLISLLKLKKIPIFDMVRHPNEYRLIGKNRT